MTDQAEAGEAPRPLLGHLRSGPRTGRQARPFNTHLIQALAGPTTYKRTSTPALRQGES